MSRGTLIAAAAICLPLAFGATATADETARLDGHFAITGKVVDATDGRTGTTIHRLWNFRSPCGSGVCERVKLIRQAKDGSRNPSWLHLTPSGEYRGVEHNRNAPCNEGPGVSRAPIAIQIDTAENGVATEISGLGTYRLKCPDGSHLRERLSFTGALKR